MPVRVTVRFNADFAHEYVTLHTPEVIYVVSYV